MTPRGIKAAVQRGAPLLIVAGVGAVGLAGFGSRVAAMASTDGVSTLSADGGLSSVTSLPNRRAMALWVNPNATIGTALLAGSGWHPQQTLASPGHPWTPVGRQLSDGSFVVSWVSTSSTLSLMVSERSPKGKWTTQGFPLANPLHLSSHLSATCPCVQVKPQLVEMPNGSVLAAADAAASSWPHPAWAGKGLTSLGRFGTVVERVRPGRWQLVPGVNGLPVPTARGAEAVWQGRAGVFTARRIGARWKISRLSRHGLLVASAIAPNGTIAAAIAAGDLNRTRLLVQEVGRAPRSVRLPGVSLSYLGSPQVEVTASGEVVVYWDREDRGTGFSGAAVGTWTTTGGFRLRLLDSTGQSGTCDPHLVVPPSGDALVFWAPASSGAGTRGYLGASEISAGGRIGAWQRVINALDVNGKHLVKCDVGSEARGGLDVVWGVDDSGSPPAGSSVIPTTRTRLFSRRWTNASGWGAPQAVLTTPGTASPVRSVYTDYTNQREESALYLGPSLGMAVTDRGGVLVRNDRGWRAVTNLALGKDESVSAVDALQSSGRTIAAVVDIEATSGVSRVVAVVLQNPV